jgi:hypothetical protein
LKNAQQHTCTKVGYLGNILTIDQSLLSATKRWAKEWYSLRRDKIIQYLYQAYRAMRAISPQPWLIVNSRLWLGNSPPCIPTANQYVSLHEAYVAKIPASSLPWTTPTIKPERVVDIALALILEGARSADHGIQIWGVTCDRQSLSLL